MIDVKGFDAGASVIYSGTAAGGTVTISEAGHAPVTLTVGANSTHWSAPVLDSSGTGILIHDPPPDASTTDQVVVTDDSGVAVTVANGTAVASNGIMDAVTRSRSTPVEISTTAAR